MEFLNAYTYAFCEKRGFTRGHVWQWSLREMARTTGCNAVILPVVGWQDHAYSTRIDSEGEDVMDREDVKGVCALARELGLKIILKAMVNCRDGYWRAYIRFLENPVPTEPAWQDWFASWQRHVCMVAKMAEENHADQLCIGCEMVGTDHRDREWRQVAAAVRQIYHGPISYNCDKYQEDYVSWWDAVDIISSSGYYPIGEIDENLQRIEKVARKFDRPFMFMECGCPSRQNSQYRPNDWHYGGDTDMEAQRAWYKAFCDGLQRHPFVRGTGWWDWPATRLYPEAAGPDNSNYCTFGKPAQEVLRQFAQSIRDTIA